MRGQNEMTVGAFLQFLQDETGCPDWTAGEDFGSSDEILLRKNCARILHRYLQKVMGVKDLSIGLPSYEDVRDIYDCRICAPHISQVLARGIMQTYTRGNLQLFEGNREVDQKEASEYIRRMLSTGNDAHMNNLTEE